MVILLTASMHSSIPVLFCTYINFCWLNTICDWLRAYRNLDILAYEPHWLWKDFSFTFALPGPLLWRPVMYIWMSYVCDVFRYDSRCNLIPIHLLTSSSSSEKTELSSIEWGVEIYSLRLQLLREAPVQYCWCVSIGMQLKDWAVTR